MATVKLRHFLLTTNSGNFVRILNSSQILKFEKLSTSYGRVGEILKNVDQNLCTTGKFFENFNSDFFAEN